MNVVKVDERIDTLIFTFSNQVKPPVIRKPPMPSEVNLAMGSLLQLVKLKSQPIT